MDRAPFRYAVIVLALLFVAGCSDDADDGNNAADATTTIGADETTTTASDTTTTTAGAEPCPAVPALPAQAVGITRANNGDVDGDGAVDAVTTYGAGARGFLRVEFAAGGGGEISMPLAGGVSVAGVVDLDGDDRSEIWATIGSGASVDLYGLFIVPECAPVAVTFDGSDATFAVGGTVTHLDGVRCDDDGAIVQSQGVSEDGSSFEVHVTTYRLEDGALVVDSTDDVTLDAGDPAFTFACT